MQCLWMLAASFFFSIMAACTKWGASFGFGTFELLFYRQFVAVILILAWVFYEGKTLLTPLLGTHIKRSLLGTASLMIWMWALGVLPLSTAMTLNYTNPLFMAGIVTFIALRHHGRIQYKLLGLLAVGFIGVAMILRPRVPGGDSWVGWFGLSSGLLAALAQLQVRQMASLREPAWRIVFFFTLTGAVFGLGGHFVTGRSLTAINWTNVWALVGLALSGVIAQLCMTKAWSGGNVLVTSSFQYFAIVFASIEGLFFFNESMSLVSIVGVILITLAGIGSTVEQRKNKG